MEFQSGKTVIVFLNSGKCFVGEGEGQLFGPMLYVYLALGGLFFQISIELSQVESG